MCQECGFRIGNASVFLIASLKMLQAVPFPGSPLDLPLFSVPCFSTIHNQREILIVHLSCACLCNLMTVLLSCIKTVSLMSPELAGGSLPLALPGKPEFLLLTTKRILIQKLEHEQ